MNYFREKITRSEITASFHIILLMVYVFGVTRLFELLPAWILHMSFWDIIGVMAYGLGFLMVESLAITAALALVFILLPRKWIKGNLFLFSALFILEWLVVFSAVNYVQLYYIRFKIYAVFAGFYPLTLYLAQKSTKLKLSFNLLFKRVKPLSSFYIGLGIVSWVIILLRNTVL